MGNNWKIVVGNFLVMFFVQFAWRIGEIVNAAAAVTDVTPLELLKIFFTSLTTTLMFYGFNKLQNSGEKKE